MSVIPPPNDPKRQLRELEEIRKRWADEGDEEVVDEIDAEIERVRREEQNPAGSPKGEA